MTDKDKMREELPPIERDEQMDRTYIPLPGGYEIQTKGKGSTFRIAKTDGSGERYPLLVPEFLHKFLEQMAMDIRAACAHKDAEHAAEIAALKEQSVTNILLRVVPGFDGCGEEVYATSVKEVVEELGNLCLAIEDSQGKLAEFKSRAEAAEAKLAEYEMAEVVAWHCWIDSAMPGKDRPQLCDYEPKAYKQRRALIVKPEKEGEKG